MKVRTGFQPRARREVRAAFHWYESKRAGLGSEFLRALDAAIEDVRRMPGKHQLVAKRTRKVLVRRFPYFIFYALEGQCILVTAVFHTSRDSRSWSDRVREGVQIGINIEQVVG